jgi:transposase
MAKAINVLASEKEIRLMEELLASGHIEHKFAVRLQTVLSRYKRLPTNNIALVLGIDHNTVSSYVRRFNTGGVEALIKDRARKPGTAPVKDELTYFACKEKPKDGTHWSTRELSKKFGISHTAVNTILRERDIKTTPCKKVSV